MCRDEFSAAVTLLFLSVCESGGSGREEIKNLIHDRDLRHERVNALLLVCIHRDKYETK